MTQAEYEDYLTKLNDMSIKNVQRIKQEHRCKRERLTSLVLDDYEFESFIFGIGTRFTMICTRCNKQWDVTDYDTW